MSLEDRDTEPMSDTLAHSHKGAEIMGRFDSDGFESYTNFTDIFCKGCDCGLMILQIHDDDDKLKIICSKCGGEQVVGIFRIENNEL